MLANTSPSCAILAADTARQRQPLAMLSINLNGPSACLRLCLSSLDEQSSLSQYFSISVNAIVSCYEL